MNNLKAVNSLMIETKGHLPHGSLVSRLMHKILFSWWHPAIVSSHYTGCHILDLHISDMPKQLLK